jgi:hypothetical protein
MKGGDPTPYKAQLDMTQDVIKHKRVLMMSSALYADTAIALKDGKFCSNQAERTSCLYCSLLEMLVIYNVEI